MPRSIGIELHVPNFDPIRSYYSGLGFSIAWERPPDGFKGYLVMQYGDNVLSFWAGNAEVYNQNYFGQFSNITPRGYAVEIVIMIDDIESYYQQVRDRANVVEDLQRRPWGLKDFRAVDPVGFYLRFSESHEITDPQYAVP